MGLLSLGTPLDWDDAVPLAEHVREHGIEQFLSLWRKFRDRSGDPLLWGDELEYMIVALDREQHTARLSLRQGEILNVLQESTQKSTGPHRPTFHPEYGRYMIESTPGTPFSDVPSDLLSVEENMRARRTIARRHLKENEVPMTITSFPRLGVRDAPFTDPPFEAKGPASRSLFLPDDLINTHVRFPTLTANIRKRRGSKVRINVPIYRDTNTPQPFVDPTIPYERDLFPEDAEAKLGAALPDHIYMDAMGFGMGCCCLQVTMQAYSVNEARKLYDQLIPVTPLLLAASAASPIYRGYLADVDCRWNVISGAVDDRTNAERGEAPCKPDEPTHNSRTGPRRLRKSRYDSVDSYLYPRVHSKDNDMDLEIDEKVRDRLLAEGIDRLLAEHIAHLFVRDPLVIFSERVDQDDEESNDHFENLQSTNWQTMRFKPPPPGSRIGWRVEFRPMEIQLTDFENAAFSVFIVLLSRAVLHFDLDLYMPLSQVDVNMQRAQLRDAIHTQKFFFCDTWTSLEDAHTPRGVREFTLAELFRGTGSDALPGFVPLVHRFLDTLHLDAAVRSRLNDYVDFVGERADGTLITAATWIRQFVDRHPAYKHDSVISEELNYDVRAHTHPAAL
ncbi:glutamate--cysteine ligase [Malassezia obtusa]|uniref:Glutamate--cysteine ligase n=1 Tax=Malassezia obtusa TaxID=76774 RepID=A0AAF0ISN0_9BASI|nr:glutamate--cysteine ligase [Malassezia obtusa]